jgi:hypothetical protein
LGFTSLEDYCDPLYLWVIKDLVHPMLDMSIGEVVVPSGRRPQFIQERSAKKKFPLQAGGCKNFITIGAGLSTK